MPIGAQSDEPEDGFDVGEAPTVEAIEQCSRELVALVDARLPERFYVRGEPAWRVGASALIARMAGLLDSATALLARRRPLDLAIIVRALYEYSVLTCWLLIEPERRTVEWTDWSRREYATLAREATRYGLELLTEQQLAHASKLDKLPPLDQRAREVDEHYGGRVRGFRSADDSKGDKGLLTMYGLYPGFYRTSSTSLHAAVQATSPCIDTGAYPWRVHREEDDDVFWASLAPPMLALALLAVGDRLRWPDSTEVINSINRMHGLPAIDEAP